MHKLLFLLFLLTTTALPASAQQEGTGIMHCIDSIMHADKKYHKILHEITAIPPTQKVQTILYPIAGESDTVLCKIGRAAKGREPKYGYYIFYSVLQNRILKASEKKAWILPKTKKEIRKKKAK